MSARWMLVLCAILAGPAVLAHAEDAPPVDPWPLPSGAPSQGAEAARATIDAADQRRLVSVRARLAPLMDDVVAAAPVDEGVQPGGGRGIVSPARAMRGLRVAARGSTEADQRTVPEMMQVLAATAFDGGVLVPDRTVLPGPSGLIERIARGPIAPSSVDDRPYVLRPSLLLRPSAVPPPPPPRLESAPQGESIVRGVRIEIDPDMLRRAFELPDAPPEGAELERLESRLLAARSGDEAASILAGFASERKAALVRSRLAGGKQSLRAVSLRALLDAAPAGPDEKATLGGLTRILGVAADPGAGDVTLYGRVEAGRPAIPLEALTLALRSVWREGRVPGCSLDPDPKDPAGLQHVRVFGVPADSTFARVMLEADYAMKQIVAAAPGAPHIEGLVDLPLAMQQDDVESAGNVASRYWLTPVPPGKGDVLCAPDRALALFDARITVRTEEMREDFAVGTGHAAAAPESVARSLGEHYDDLARAVPAFASLQGLFDVVMASQVLRTVAPQHPLLERAADRGFVPVSVPTTYQGVHVSHVLPGRLIVLEGGCQAGSPIATDALIEAPPELLAALPAAGRGVVEAPVYRSVGRAADVGAALLAGRAALAARRFEEAEDLATDALDLSHNDAAALSLRGVARVRGGRTYAGILDALEAMRRAPGDPTYEANLRALLEELGDADAFEGLTKPAAEVLATDYMARAATAALGRDFDAARAAASLARRVAPDAIDARVLLATVTWVAGDLPRARAIADEAAQSAPRSAEAQALVGWIATTQGDLPGASRALDRAIALEDTAEARGTRSAVRLVTGDLRGAGEDAYQALRLDVACWATDMAQRGLRLAACLGAADAARMLAASFRLPPSVQLDLYEAQHLMQTGDDAGAVAPYKQALGALLQDGVDEEVLKSSYAREMVMLMLARSITRAVPPVPADLEQVEPMLRAVEREHPDWVVPRWMRVTLAQARGDGAAALAALATCRGADPQADPMMRQFVPPSKAGFEGLLALLGATLPFTVPQGGPPPPEAFERLRAAYRGGPSEGVADALASVLETALLGDQDPASVAARAKLTQRAREVEAAPQATRAPEDVLIRASLLGGRVSAIVAGEGDDRDLASAMKALASLSPVPDVYESVTGTVAQTRKQALLSAIQGFVEQVERDPRSHRAQNLAEDDPDTARRLVASVVGPARDRAASLGEPVLAHFVDLVLIGVTADVDGRALEARMRRVKRVLEVATDPAKIARLEAAERDIEARIASLGTDLGRRAGARTEALRDALRTPCDVATLGALRTVMAQGATQRGERPEPPDPQDARRAAEVALGASLDALGVPRPEGLR